MNDDDRILCRDCEHFQPRGACGAALAGTLKHLAKHARLDPGRRHRCAGYQPGRDDPDQRTGAERFPGCARWQLR